MAASKRHAVITLFNVPNIFVNSKSRRLDKWESKLGTFLTHRLRMCAPSRNRIPGRLLCYWTPSPLCYIGCIFADRLVYNRANRPRFLWFQLASCSLIDHRFWNESASHGSLKRKDKAQSKTEAIDSAKIWTLYQLRARRACIKEKLSE